VALVIRVELVASVIRAAAAPPMAVSLALVIRVVLVALVIRAAWAGLGALPGSAMAVLTLASTGLLTPTTSSLDLVEMAGRIPSAQPVAIPSAQPVAIPSAQPVAIPSAQPVAMVGASSIPSARPVAMVRAREQVVSLVSVTRAALVSVTRAAPVSVTRAGLT
jgi:hypothetical protein